MKKYITFNLILAILLLASAVHAKPGSLNLEEPDFVSGEFTLNDEDELLWRAWDSIQEAPYDYERYGRLGFLCDLKGYYECELWALRQEAAYMPEDVEGKDTVYGNLARAFMLNDKWEQGKEWLDKADEIDPDNPFNRWNAFGYYIQHENNFEEAIKQIETLDRIYESLKLGRDPYYSAFLKIMYLGVDQRRIIDFLTKAVQSSPKNHKAHRALGAAVRMLNVENLEQFDKSLPVALKHLRDALKLNEDYLLTYISFGQSYILRYNLSKDKEDLAKAMDWYDKAYTRFPDSAKLAFTMGDCFIFMREDDKAIERLEFALNNGLDEDKVVDRLATAYNNKAYGYYERGENLEEGLKYIDKAIDMRPENGIILSTKAELLYKLNRYEEAFILIKKGIELEPEYEEIQNDYKMIKEALKRE